MTFIYLASQSPRRRQLLDQLGVAVSLLLPDDAEAAEALEAVRPGEAPAAYVRRVTRLKLGDAARRLAQQQQQRPPAPVLCADTTVALGRQILGDWRGEALSDSRVRFAPLPEAAIDAYVASGEWQGKAGAYAIQGRAAAFIEHISGSYSGIMGLPLHETAALLRQAGVKT